MGNIKYYLIFLIALIQFSNCVGQMNNKPAMLYTEVDKLPEFTNGKSMNLSEYINLNLKWPSPEMTVSGTVLLSFIITKEGEVSRLEVERSLQSKFDESALKTFRDMPNWNPGYFQGNPVDVLMYYPVRFNLK